VLDEVHTFSLPVRAVAVRGRRIAVGLERCSRECVVLAQVEGATLSLQGGVGHTFADEGVLSLAWLDDRRLVVGTNSHLRLVHVSDPWAPAFLSALPTSGEAEDLQRAGEGVVAAMGNFGVHVLEPSDDGRSLAHIGDFLTRLTNPSLRTATVAGDVVYAGQFFEGVVWKGDSSNPRKPLERESRAVVSEGVLWRLRAATDGTRLYAATDEGLLVLDSRLATTGVYRPSSGRTTDVAELDGGAVLVANAALGVELVEVADARAPRVVSALADPEGAYRVAVDSASRIFAAARNGDGALVVGHLE